MFVIVIRMEKFYQEKKISELDDGCDEVLNISYENIKDRIEKPLLISATVKTSNQQANEKSELDDGSDEILNKCYENVMDRTKKPSLIPRNMLNLVKYSKKEIKKNHLLAKIRLMERRRGLSMKSQMSDYFYYFESWPNFAIKIILSRDFGYADRLGLACFFHGNGLRDKGKAVGIFQFYNKYWDNSKDWRNRFLKFEALFDYLDKAYENTDEGDRIRNEYYYYSVELNLTLFYDGYVRSRNGEKRKYEVNYK